MRLISFGQPDAALADALAAEGFEIEVRSLSAPDGAQATDALAGALREVEGILDAAPPRAMLVSGTHDAALAAAITGVKLGIPTAYLGDPGGNAPLAARVAELVLDATADSAASARAVRELAESRIPSA